LKQIFNISSWEHILYEVISSRGPPTGAVRPACILFTICLIWNSVRWKKMSLVCRKSFVELVRGLSTVAIALGTCSV